MPVLPGVRTENWGAAQFAVSDDGTLAFVPGVTVTNPDGSSGSLSGVFRILGLAAPRILTLNPTSKLQARGTPESLTIDGFDFLDGAQVDFTPNGFVGVTNIMVNSSSQIVLTLNIAVPPPGPGPPSGQVFQVRVINPDGLQSNPVTYTAP